jgi:ABC-type transport system involved in cytochrome c biogenesis permease subunit
MIAGALFATLALLVRRRWFDLIAVAVMLAGFGVLTYGLAMRWQIAGRIPAANMFESLLFLSWGMGAFAIVSLLLFEQRLVPLTSSIMGALALFLADVLPLDGFVRPIVPVLLDTYWMSIHVPVIMLSYSVLALAALIAHIQLVLMAAVPRRRPLIDKVDSMHYAYILLGAVLLLCGIITGSIWGASSWGRYWGWDPKEVWSLIAFLGYLTTLHVRLDRQRVPPWAWLVAAALGLGVFAVVVPHLTPLTPMRVGSLIGAGLAMVAFVALRGQFATAFKSILAFWLIMMTYVGVNFVLGIGLHSYGFGTGAIAPRMFAAGAIDLTFAIVCGAIYLARRPAPEAGYNGRDERLRAGLSQTPAR